MKFNIFLVAIKKTMYYVTFFSAIFSLVATFYYLRVIKILYFEPILVGKLYYPLNEHGNIAIITILFHFFLFSFINPSFFYLLTYKACLLFFN